MDKVSIQFIADILYCKEIININEYERILDAKNSSDLEVIIDKMLSGGSWVKTHG